MDQPDGITIDAAKNIYVTEFAGHRVRKINGATGIISTIAGSTAGSFGGSGTWGFSGDGGPATAALLRNPTGVAADGAGNVYIADSWNWRIRKITASNGIINTIAGTSSSGFNGNGILALNAQLNLPTDVVLDGVGNIYISDALNNKVRKVDVATGIINTIAGTGTAGYNGDGIPATTAELMIPTGVAIDDSCNIYIADQTNNRVRKVKGVGIPNVTVSGTNSICAGQSVQLSVSGAFIYSWNTGSTSQGINITPTGTTTYTAIGTSSLGCVSRIPYTVSVNPIPVVSISRDSNVCIGASITLSASGASSYLWSNGQTSSFITISPNTITTYSLHGTSNGCSDTALHMVTANAPPSVTISGNSSICVGSSTTLSALGGTTYLWNSGATSNFINVTPGGNTTYSVVGTSIMGCHDTAYYLITVINFPVVNINGSTSVCSGSSITLSGSGATYYNWNNGATSSSISISPTSNTTYSLIGTSPGGCSALAVATITLNNLPNASISGNNTICAGGNSTLTASGGNSYMWSNGNSTNILSITPSANGTYSVIVTDNNGCTNTAMSYITVNPLPSVLISGNTTICNGYSTTLSVSGALTYSWSTGATSTSLTITPTSLSNNYSVTGTDNNGCSASSATTITMHAPSVFSTTIQICEGKTVALPLGGSTDSSGIYTFTLSNSFGCDSLLTLSVIVNSLPSVSITSSTDTIKTGEAVTLYAQGANSYIWTEDERNSSVLVSPTATTTYYLTGENAAGCKDTTSITIYVINKECEGDLFSPTAFSPNGDGQNDTWKLSGLSCIKSANIFIYDRWGKRVFASQDMNDTWDGTYESNLLDTDVFVYKIIAVLYDNTTFIKSGNISLIR